MLSLRTLSCGSHLCLPLLQPRVLTQARVLPCLREMDVEKGNDPFTFALRCPLQRESAPSSLSCSCCSRSVSHNLKKSRFVPFLLPFLHLFRTLLEDLEVEDERRQLLAKTVAVSCSCVIQHIPTSSLNAAFLSFKRQEIGPELRSRLRR